MPRDDVKILEPDKSLKKKIGENVNLDTVFTKEKIQRAEQVVENNRADLVKEAETHLVKLEEAFQQYSKGDHTPIVIGAMLNATFAIKSTAGMFQYNLATAVAKSLYNYLEHRKSLNAGEQSVVESHISAIKGIFHNKVVGDGGKIGEELLKSIDALIRKFSG